MDKDVAEYHWKYSGAFRVQLRGGISIKNIPRSSFVGVVGNEICIIQGTIERVSGGWIFKVKEDSFGWEDFEIMEIIAGGKIIFDERGFCEDHAKTTDRS